MNERPESGQEVGVLSREQHVSPLAALAKTAFSYSIVPHSDETFTLWSLMLAQGELFKRSTLNGERLTATLESYRATQHRRSSDSNTARVS